MNKNILDIESINLTLSRDQAGNLGWILNEQLKSLKKLQRKEKDEMQPIIDDLQYMANSLLKQLQDGGKRNERKVMD